MNTRRRLWWWTLVAFLLASGAVAEPLKVVFYQGGHPPFMFPEGEATTGIYRDILDRVTERSGVEFEFHYFPFQRAQSMFEKGRVDVEPGINPVWRADSAVPGEFSVPFAKAVDLLLFRPGKDLEVGAPEDLSGRSVGVIKGYVYPFFTEAFEAGTVVRDDAITETAVLEKLVHGRYDQAVLNEAVALWWLKRHPEYQDYEVGSPIGDVEIMFRVHPSKAQELTRINQALEEMIADGEIEAIYARYR